MLQVRYIAKEAMRSGVRGHRADIFATKARWSAAAAICIGAQAHAQAPAILPPPSYLCRSFCCFCTRIALHHPPTASIDDPAACVRMFASCGTSSVGGHRPRSAQRARGCCSRGPAQGCGARGRAKGDRIRGPHASAQQPLAVSWPHLLPPVMLDDAGTQQRLVAAVPFPPS